MGLREWWDTRKRVGALEERILALEEAFQAQRLDILDTLERVTYRLDERTRKRKQNGGDAPSPGEALAEGRRRYGGGLF